MVQDSAKLIDRAAHIKRSDARVNRPNTAHHPEPVQFRHLNIAQNPIRWIAEVSDVALYAVMRRAYFKARRSQCQGDNLGQRLIIIDDQYRGNLCRHSLRPHT